MIGSRDVITAVRRRAGTSWVVVLGVAGVFATVAGVVSNYGALVAWTSQWRIPAVDVVLVDYSGPSPSYATPRDTLFVAPSNVDVAQQVVAIPLDACIRNREKSTIEEVVLTLSGDKPMHLKSSGRRLFLPGKTIAEHVFTHLAPCEVFRGMDSVDTLYVPVRLEAFGWLAFDRSDCPVMVPWALSDSAEARTVIEFVRLRVSCVVSGRPKYIREYVVGLGSLYVSLWPTTRTLCRPRPTDVALFRSLGGSSQNSVAHRTILAQGLSGSEQRWKILSLKYSGSR
jgi:hypothetical protein